MPRYFFHLSNKDILLEDCEGRDLPDLRAALEEVLKVHQELGPDLSEAYGLEFVVSDCQGRALLKVPFPETRQRSSQPVVLEQTGKGRGSAPQSAPGYLH
jgi:hypothetical protein